MSSINRIIIVVMGMAAMSQAHALMWTWTTTTMSGLEEVPFNSSPGSGMATGTLDDVTGSVVLTSGGYTGMLAPVTAAHIHGLAPPGSNAGVILPLGTTGGTSGTLTGGGVLPPALVSGMISGLTYVNVHTSSFPGGEIRGQISATPVPEPASMVAVGIGIAALILKRRKR